METGRASTAVQGTQPRGHAGGAGGTARARPSRAAGTPLSPQSWAAQRAICSEARRTPVRSAHAWTRLPGGRPRVAPNASLSQPRAPAPPPWPSGPCRASSRRLTRRLPRVSHVTHTDVCCARWSANCPRTPHGNPENRWSRRFNLHTAAARAGRWPLPEVSSGGAGTGPGGGGCGRPRTPL